MNLILSGPPSVGKTTQGSLLAEWMGVPHISSGQLIRSGAAQGSPDAIAMLASTADGSLAPSDAIIGLVLDRLSESDCLDGYVLDGFPRKAVEARAICGGEFRPDMFIALKASQDVLMQRLLSRAAIAGRQDDDPSVFPRRVAVYRRETELVSLVMREHGVVVHSVDAEGEAETIQTILRSVVPEIRPAAAPAF